MIQRLFCFVVFLLLMGAGFAQHKKIGYSGYFSLGLNIPTYSENNVGELSFIKLGSQTQSYPGLEIGGAVYYRNIGFNLGFGFYKYELDIAKYQSDMQNFYPNNDVATYMSALVKSVPVFAGISYFISIGDFGIEPRFLVRLDKTITPNTADVYFWNNEQLIRSIYYSNQSNMRLDYVPAISLSYYYPVSRELSFGIQLNYQYSFSKPQFKYFKKDIDAMAGNVVQTTENETVNYSASNLGLGFVVRFK